MVTTTLCTSGMVLAKAGIGYNTNLDGKSAAIVGSDFIVDLWIVEAENYINDLTRYNWITNYTSLSADKRKILQEFCSASAAVNAIAYDMGGFSSRGGAQDKINVLRENVEKCAKILDEDKTQSWISGTED